MYSRVTANSENQKMSWKITQRQAFANGVPVWKSVKGVFIACMCRLIGL